jgi:hypothetical protein
VHLHGILSPRHVERRNAPELDGECIAAFQRESCNSIQCCTGPNAERHPCENSGEDAEKNPHRQKGKNEKIARSEELGENVSVLLA